MRGARPVLYLVLTLSRLYAGLCLERAWRELIEFAAGRTG